MTESAACHCMGPQNGEPFCPCMMNRLGIIKRGDKWIEPEKVVGDVIDVTKPQMPFSQKWETKQCMDYRHNPPMGLYVAPGETYVHICPSCGATRSLTSLNITCQTPDHSVVAPEFVVTTESFDETFIFSEDEDKDAFTSESDDEIKKTLKVV